MDVLLDLLDPKWWLTMFGAFATIGVLLIIFAETGLLFGFFLPGDSMLVAAGIFAVPAAAAGLGISPLSLPVLLIGAPLAAIAGAQLGHFLGAKFGRKLFDRPDSRLFKQEHVQKAEYYFEKFGPAKAVVLARFVPIVRTFLNPVAGVLGMDARRFLLWNVVGGLLWIESLLLFGYFVGTAVENIDRYILPGVFVIVLLSILPIVREVIKNRKSGGAPLPEGASRPAAEGPAAERPAKQMPISAEEQRLFDLYAQRMNLPVSGDPFGGAAGQADPFGAQPGGPNGGGHPGFGRPDTPGGGAFPGEAPYQGGAQPGGGWPGEPYRPGGPQADGWQPSGAQSGGTYSSSSSRTGLDRAAGPQQTADADWPSSWQSWPGPDGNR